MDRVIPIYPPNFVCRGYKNGYRGVSRGIFKSSAGLELKNNPS
jgi:hypothetical protein